MAQKDVGVRDQSSATCTIDSWTENLGLSCNSDADAVICDVLGTLINELIKKGILNGTVSA